MRTDAASGIVQTCYVVRDLDAACARLHALLGIGPFVGGVDIALEHHQYRGMAADPIRLRGAFVQSGAHNIELVQILSPGPSAFHDLFPDGGEGMHHAAMFCADYVAERDRWVAAGYPVASEFTTGFGAQICYIDARPLLGHFIELYPENPIIRGMFAQTAQESRDWDGRAMMVPWR